MEGKTILRVTIIVVCLAVTGLGYQNSSGDNSEVVALATTTACEAGGQGCTASLGQTSRSSFGHEYLFNVQKGQTPGLKSQLVVACKRELIFIGDWKCAPKP